MVAGMLVLVHQELYMHTTTWLREGNQDTYGYDSPRTSSRIPETF